MRILTVSLLLSVSPLLEFGPTVSAVSLSVRPNLQQFLSGDAVYLSCDEGGRTVRTTAERQTAKRSAETGQCGKYIGSSCFISGLSPSDSGLYWCETSDGQRSEQINITVQSDRPLKLEIPALPVTAGSEVTLRCRTKDGSTPAAYFFRNNVHVRDKAAAEQLKLSNVQQSDEGFYSCSTDMLGSSPQSWLRVKGPSPTTVNTPPSLPSTPPTSPVTTPVFQSIHPSSPSAPPSSPSAPPTFLSAPPPSLLPVSWFRLLCHLVVVGLFCISSVLMVLRCCSKTAGNKLTVEESNDITGDVITEHNF
ncbi:brother of CDO-like [Solea solea]|uniref:brother of CDO-like n=1 Tax=Solea solea TaxID=90069 RepID=UPI00272B9D17|nr:brother of CDO-like [Solea solea]